VGEYHADPSSVDASGMRVAVVAGRFNLHITGALVEGCVKTLAARGVADADVTIAWVPGAFELPLVAKRLAASGSIDAVVCLGAIIRGETAHFDYVAMGATQGILHAGLDTGVPVVFGVLTVDTLEQAHDRIGGKDGHKGEEAALTAIEMVALLRALL
jgi:6,7-dimethyl-8-ribityllumazine synthase